MWRVLLFYGQAFSYVRLQFEGSGTGQTQVNHLGDNQVYDL